VEEAGGGGGEPFPCSFPSLTDAFAKTLRTFLARSTSSRHVVIIVRFYLARYRDRSQRRYVMLLHAVIRCSPISAAFSRARGAIVPSGDAGRRSVVTRDSAENVRWLKVMVVR